MLPIRLKLIRKKTAQTWRSTFSRDSGFFHPTSTSVRLTRNGSFFFGIIFRRFRLHYENTAEMVLILETLSKNTALQRCLLEMDQQDRRHGIFWMIGSGRKKQSDHPLLFTWDRCWISRNLSKVTSQFRITKCFRLDPRSGPTQKFRASNFFLLAKKQFISPKLLGFFPACHLNFLVGRALLSTWEVAEISKNL